MSGLVIFYELIVIFRPKRGFKKPMDDVTMQMLSRKNFSDETCKKINWVTNMFQHWREFRNGSPDLINVISNLDDVSSLDKETFNSDVCRFITEVKKLDGSDYPAKTLYDIVICLQFHLEKSGGLSWKLLNEDGFKEIHFTLDNLMKKRTADGVGIKVKRAEVLTFSDEDLLWSLGLLGTHCPESLLYSVLFTVGLSCSLRAGKEHYQLRSIPFQSQFEFLNDEKGRVYFHYTEDRGLKTNKGGLKNRKTEPKIVDVYPLDDIDRCPVRILHKYLCMIPHVRNCKHLYLQPRKKYHGKSWFLDSPVGENKLRNFVKDLCTKANIPGFYTNHSLRATGAIRLYQNDVDEQIIQEIMGHRSLAVRSYKHTSDKQREFASNTIFGHV